MGCSVRASSSELGGASAGRAVRCVVWAASWAALIVAARWTPDVALPHIADVSDALWRVWAYAASIVLEAGPFVLAGALVAALVPRIVRGGGAFPILVTAFAPGCDCSMNGFAAALRRCPAPLAGMALTWGAACNPVALVATAAMLGSHLLAARIAGALAAAAVVGLLWHSPSDARRAFDDQTSCPTDLDVGAHLENGLRVLLPAAFASAAALALVPDALRAHASPLAAAITGAVLSPCSTADPVLARILMTSAQAQAVFVIAGQCLDARQLLLLRRHFGVRRAVLAALAGVVGCIAAAGMAR